MGSGSCHQLRVNMPPGLEAGIFIKKNRRAKRRLLILRSNNAKRVAQAQTIFFLGYEIDRAHGGKRIVEPLGLGTCTAQPHDMFPRKLRYIFSEYSPEIAQVLFAVGRIERDGNFASARSSNPAGNVRRSEYDRYSREKHCPYSPQVL